MKGLEKFDRKPLLFKRQMWERDGCRAWDWASVGTWGHSVEISASAFLRRGLKGRQRCQGAEAFEAVSGGGGQGERRAEPGARRTPAHEHRVVRSSRGAGMCNQRPEGEVEGSFTQDGAPMIQPSLWIFPISKQTSCCFSFL